MDWQERDIEAEITAAEQWWALCLRGEENIDQADNETAEQSEIQ